MLDVAVILAAGKGTRMRSDLPKVLHPLGGAPLVAHALRAALDAGADRCVVVVGHGADAVRAAVERWFSRTCATGRIEFVVQEKQHGTGHAVLCALPSLPRTDARVWILSGDVPSIRASTLRSLADACSRSGAGLALATFRPPSPEGYGRIVRDDGGRVVAIREHVDASESERAIEECNAGIYSVEVAKLHATLPRLRRDNAKNEIYLTDLVGVLATEAEVVGIEIDPREAAGVNTPEQLASLEAEGRGDRKPLVPEAASA